MNKEMENETEIKIMKVKKEGWFKKNWKKVTYAAGCIASAVAGFGLGWFVATSGDPKYEELPFEDDTVSDDIPNEVSE